MVQQVISLKHPFTDKAYGLPTMIKNYHEKRSDKKVYPIPIIPFDLKDKKKEKKIKDILWKIETSNNKAFSFWTLERLLTLSGNELERLYNQLKFI